MIRIVWGITGSGDRIHEILDIMTNLHEEQNVKITVILSKAAEQVLRGYKLWELLHSTFDKVLHEQNANAPFIAGSLQIGKYDLLVIAPLTANSTAKIAHGIADTLVTNAVAQTLKGTTPVLLYPVDQSLEPIRTIGPDGIEFTIQPRAIDLDNVNRLRNTERLVIANSPSEIDTEIRVMLNSNRGNPR
ncbi:MAG: archaeoflavoprotein AfpA [Candidatus Thorarchaeota archaeon]|nr:archaeoflavoprotein AfpA [Candidatus Thorarchaeota archaeon]